MKQTSLSFKNNVRPSKVQKFYISPSHCLFAPIKHAFSSSNFVVVAEVAWKGTTLCSEEKFWKTSFSVGQMDGLWLSFGVLLDTTVLRLSPWFCIFTYWYHAELKMNGKSSALLLWNECVGLASNRKFLKRVDDIKFFVILSFMLCSFAIFWRTWKEMSLGFFGINTKSAFHRQFFITYFFSVSLKFGDC